MIPNKNTGGYFATHYDEIIHWLMACYAGFGGMYSVVLHARNFVNAQTGNLMSITEDFWAVIFLRHDEGRGPHHVCRWGCGFFPAFPENPKDMRKIVICVNAVAITLVALMPLTWDPIMTIYPMIFAASFQWGTFSEAQGYASATIFLSNNTKQSVLAWTQFFMTKDWKYFHKAILYTGTILSFMAGCLAAGFAVLREGVYGAFYGYALLVIAMILVHLSDRYGGTEEEEAMDRIKEVEEEEKMPV